MSIVHETRSFGAFSRRLFTAVRNAFSLVVQGGQPRQANLDGPSVSHPVVLRCAGARSPVVHCDAFYWPRDGQQVTSLARGEATDTDQCSARDAVTANGAFALVNIYVEKGFFF